MTGSHVVVDGSNIATEGRSLPSLKQLIEALEAYEKEFPDDRLTVVVDATFGHRIDEKERPAYEKRASRGEMITPPAGVIGRGDAFILEIAERASANVLSNDSFQEFHGEHAWLFDEGRLVGGKPVPHVGWVFMLRAPVRGPASRRSQRSSRSRGGTKGTGSRRKPANDTQARAKERATKIGASKKAAPVKRSPVKKSVEEPQGKKRSEDDANGDERTPRRKRGRSRGRGNANVEPINEPMAFINFVAAYKPGDSVIATVDRFASHGAYVVVGDARCYVPLKAMADPAPRSAKEVLTIGSETEFIVESIDTPRRGIDLSLAAKETLDIKTGSDDDPPSTSSLESDSTPLSLPDQAVEDEVPEENKEKPSMAVKKQAAKKKAPAKKRAVKKTAAKKSVRKTTAKKRPAAKKKSTAKKASTKKTTAKKSTAKKTTAKKTTAKKTTAKKTTAKKSTAKKTTAKKATKKKSTAKKAPAKKASGARKA